MKYDEIIEALKQSPYWDIFTRAEEYNSRGDEHGRFPYNMTTYKDISRPVVSEYLHDLGLVDIKYPGGHDFALVLTHDIDIVYPSIIRSGISIVREFTHMSRMTRWLKYALGHKGASPYLNAIETIASREEELGGRSSMLIITASRDKTGSGGYFDDIKSLLRDLEARGFDIGLHGSYSSHLNTEMMQRERQRLLSAVDRVESFRAHYLRFSVPESWHVIASAGFRVDSTLGYASHEGFRNGMVHPFYPYDIHNARPIDIVEVPLAIMDATLYRRYDLKEARKIVRRFIETARELNGTLVLLWHNDTFANPSLRRWGELYWEILEYAIQRNGYLCSLRDINSIFRRRYRLS